MNPYPRAAAFVLRLVAFGLILFGALPLGMNYFAARQQKPTSGVLWMALEILSLLAGIVLLFTSGAVAKKLTEDLEE